MDRDHLSEGEWAAYRQRTLSASELLAVSDHLAACPVCAARREENPASSSVDWAEPELDAAPYEDLVAWIEGTMTDPVDREIFEARLQLDPQLRAEATDLAAFRVAMDRLPPQTHSPAKTTAVPSNIVAFPSPRGWLLPLAAAAAVMATMLIWSVFQISRGDRSAIAASDDLARALATGKLDVPSLPPELRPDRETLAGEAGEPSALTVVQPLGRIVRERQPRLTWRSSAAADTYTVQMQPLDGGPLISSPALPATAREWQPTEPLHPGTIYEWQVQALKAGAPVDQAPKPPEPEARFQILPPEAEAQLRAAEGSPNKSELRLGLTCAQVGLFQEADTHWQAAGPEGQRLRAALKAAGR